jgi:hypothetical protein
MAAQSQNIDIKTMTWRYFGIFSQGDSLYIRKKTVSVFIYKLIY